MTSGSLSLEFLFCLTLRNPPEAWYHADNSSVACASRSPRDAYK